MTGSACDVEALCSEDPKVMRVITFQITQHSLYGILILFETFLWNFYCNF